MPDPTSPPSPAPTADLTDALIAIGRAAPGGSPDAAPATLYDRHGVLVIRVGEVVVKAHQADRDNGPRLVTRMAAAAELPHLLLPPVGPPREVLGRVVTVWPYGEPVSPDDPPWEAGGGLLARLHAAAPPPVTATLPRWERPVRAAGVVARMRALDGTGAGEREILRAFASLPAWVRGEGAAPAPSRTALVHGDWHLGQLVGVADGTWRLIDVEDLGVGDPAWDLARPAALFSAGVLPAADWARFLGAYRDAGGPAVPADGDPWDMLDVPARTLAIQIAATCVIVARAERRPLDGFESALVDTCWRIAESGESSGS
ncbi:phosphotransferase family protein [Thermomonospora umbrina]|uniref:phosphotransferase family protein n=1 Tax=Thermomonospora umbrina TaxID=111806 RepID=UPI001FEB284A|nr:aminoglycoside phosphotransferase family protein [Thermomonospora umbrina]